MKPVKKKEVSSEEWHIYTLLDAAQRNMECFNLQLQMHNVLIFETLNTDI